MLLALTTDSDAQRLRERADAILWVKTQMAKFGLHLSDLEQAGCFARPPLDKPAELVRFRDAQGHTWDGCGDPPDWLQRALNAGQSIAHFLIER